jgi:hypothetical protein
MKKHKAQIFIMSLQIIVVFKIILFEIKSIEFLLMIQNEELGI